MKRPWQIWLAFGLCLAVAIPALVWLTRVALRLDYQQRLQQSRAELDEVVGNVLWQTDAALTRIIAPETARPHYMFRPLWTMAGGNGQPTAAVSPLLLQPSPYVRIHFQISPAGEWSSPECAEGLSNEQLQRWGISPQNVALARKQLEQLQTLTSAQHILAHITAPLPASSQIVSDDGESNWRNPVIGNRYVENWLRNNSLDAPEQLPTQTVKGGKGEYAQQVQESAQALRRGVNLQQRSEFFQEQAQQQLTQQNSTFNQLNLTAASLEVTEGPTEIFWNGDQLLAARQVVINGESHIQGCWFDWEKLHRQIVKDALAVLPSAKVVPVKGNAAAGPLRVLAVVPARLDVPEPTVVRQEFTAVHWALLIAWSLLALAALSTAALLHGVVALSERRASFVSAVTHELRTPLTTFRLYSEMLAEGMVTDERRKTYLETLQREAERLSHLVENVLQYARLERGAGKRRQEAVPVPAMMQRIEPSLSRRAEQAGMQLEITLADDAARLSVFTDTGIVEQILFNLVDNASKYAAAAEDRCIHCDITAHGEHVVVTIRDHGPGISAREAKRLFRPFHKSAEQAAESAPGVGLGLALCRRLAKQIGGQLHWHPSSEGAAFRLVLPVNAQGKAT